MAALQAALGAGGGGDPLAALAGGGGPGPGGGDGQLADLLGGAGPGGDAGPAPEDKGGSDLLNGMGSTDHIRAAIKHLMMAMTESKDDGEGHGIVKGMAALHGILASKQKSDATVTAAGGTPAGG